MWKSKARLHKFYSSTWCKERNFKPLSSCTFHKTFEDLNLALYILKKDQCDTCRVYSLKLIDQQTYDEHISKKGGAREEKEKDTANEEHVYTVDLQYLLLSPKPNASAIYYRSKLALHNLCIFNHKTKDGYSYLWNEVEGGLTFPVSSIIS